MDAAAMNRVVHTLLEEFSDLADVEQITRVLLRLTLAALLGGVLLALVPKLVARGSK
jgi:hypothetical protein